MTNRIYKFRAWAKSEKSMITEMVGFVIDPNKKRFRYFRINKSNKDGMGTDVTDLENIILMQWTGLFDKRGKEIYEKDKVKDIYGNIGIVEWHDERAAWTFMDGYNELLFTRFPVIIIGNKFENKQK